jgi:hypothetical protein
MSSCRLDRLSVGEISSRRPRKSERGNLASVLINAKRTAEAAVSQFALGIAIPSPRTYPAGDKRGLAYFARGHQQFQWLLHQKRPVPHDEFYAHTHLLGHPSWRDTLRSRVDTGSLYPEL